MNRIKKGDTVVVVAGKQKGEQGEVLRMLPKKNQAVVQGINVKTKHEKPSMTNPQGGIVKSEAPVDLSNLMPLDPESKKGTRVSHQSLESGKVRVGKSGQQLDK